MKENALSHLIDNYLRDLEGKRIAWRLNVAGSAGQRGGVPDFLICYKGWFVAIELKRPDGTYGVTKRQGAHMRRIEAAGGYTAKIESVEELDTFLKKISPR